MIGNVKIGYICGWFDVAKVQSDAYPNLMYIPVMKLDFGFLKLSSQNGITKYV